MFCRVTTEGLKFALSLHICYNYGSGGFFMIKKIKALVCVLLAAVMLFAVIPSYAIVSTDSTLARNEIQVYSFLIGELNLNEAAACGIMANIWGESRFDSTAENSSSAAFGICQWLGTRRSALESYCASIGMDYRTVDGQLAYLKAELASSEYRAYDKIKTVANTRDGAYDAGYIWQQYFERGPVKYRTIYAEKARDVFWSSYRPLPTHSGGCYSFEMYDVPVYCWYHSAVDYGIQKGYMKGISGIRFAPNDNMTRGMMITVLYRIAGSPSVSGTNFSDVPSGKYYTSAALWGKSKGIINGYDDGRFGPDDHITREQVAVIMHKFGTFMSISPTARSGSVTGFYDYYNISNYAREAFSWAHALGIFTGDNYNCLNPRSNATRKEISAVIYRIVTKYKLV